MTLLESARSQSAVTALPAWSCVNWLAVQRCVKLCVVATGTLLHSVHKPLLSGFPAVEMMLPSFYFSRLMVS
jgi:hypothetical protein